MRPAIYLFIQPGVLSKHGQTRIGHYYCQKVSRLRIKRISEITLEKLTAFWGFESNSREVPNFITPSTAPWGHLNPAGLFVEK